MTRGGGGGGGASSPLPPSPFLLPPATPSELLTHTLAHLRHPTTLIVCWPKEQFVEALVQDVRQQQQQQLEQEQEEQRPHVAPRGDDTADENGEGGAGASASTAVDAQGGSGTAESQQRPAIPAQQLLSATLLQVSISRHIRMLFVPSVVHLRAHLAASSFSGTISSSSTPPPPPAGHPPPQSDIMAPPAGDGKGGDGDDACPRNRRPTTRQHHRQQQHRPLLLVYGLLELHRDGTEWSARGLNASLAELVECAARCGGLVPVLVEPRRMERDKGADFGGQHHHDGGASSCSSPELLAALAEPVPILSGAERRRDGSWRGKTVPIRRVLARWFDVPPPAGG
ncbi:hypothetical protein JDV02_000009 [Purpureocillium takamizusanense]|uniref:Uncharacterized protein n=1 Tax=Purpureocillium takamizusanense TaxID=2060973 RepID=A0A9Q8Q6A9_9HYPO|nr:uncharacterized protein JDV02_000009 [Purpureocillium takamizusanense]UNI13252.1 hypothetical protein JDV02_000009 [Purpureocillium takamizusanense]